MLINNYSAKTYGMMISGSRTCLLVIALLIKNVRELKILGVVIDSKLTM